MSDDIVREFLVESNENLDSAGKVLLNMIAAKGMEYDEFIFSA